MRSIASFPLACEYAIPDSPDPTVEIDFDLIRLFAAGTRRLEEIPYLDSPSICESSEYGGWYYDSLLSPSKLLMCSCSCAQFGASAIQVKLGCARPWISGAP